MSSDIITERLEAIRDERQAACPCNNTPIPFDPVAARDLEAHEVRARWPRVEGCCPLCGRCGVRYASHEHYIAGDW